MNINSARVLQRNPKLFAFHMRRRWSFAVSHAPGSMRSILPLTTSPLLIRMIRALELLLRRTVTIPPVTHKPLLLREIHDDVHRRDLAFHGTDQSWTTLRGSPKLLRTGGPQDRSSLKISPHQWLSPLVISATPSCGRLMQRQRVWKTRNSLRSSGNPEPAPVSATGAWKWPTMKDVRPSAGIAQPPRTLAKRKFPTRWVQSWVQQMKATICFAN